MPGRTVGRDHDAGCGEARVMETSPRAQRAILLYGERKLQEDSAGE